MVEGEGEYAAIDDLIKLQKYGQFTTQNLVKFEEENMELISTWFSTRDLQAIMYILYYHAYIDLFKIISLH